VLGYPHPGCFAKRGCKLLILKGDDSKKSAKRLQLPECKDLSLAGRLRREVIRRANMAEIIISVYRLSSVFLVICPGLVRPSFLSGSVEPPQLVSFLPMNFTLHVTEACSHACKHRSYNSLHGETAWLHTCQYLSY
jgi:hypothetical protein